jgi:pimeloyl-ACP methyl ester carboxylesterase
MNAIPKPPPITLALSELPRAGVESLRLLSGLGSLIRRHRGGDGHPVLVLPGYGAADGSTAGLRFFLRRIGYRPFALDAGRNVEGLENRIQSVDDATRFRERLVALTVERVREVHASTGESVSLIGWSMGGLYALDASRCLPEITRQVITLGSPFGDPRGTSLFTLMRRLSGSTVPIEEQDFDSWLGKAVAPSVPTRVIYSHRDGIVSTDIARLPASPLSREVQVDSSHLGFAFNTQALAEVAVALKSAAPC